MNERLNNLAYRSNEAAVRAESLVQLLGFTLENVADEPQDSKRLYGLIGSFVTIAIDLERYLSDMSQEAGNIAEAVSKI